MQPFLKWAGGKRWLVAKHPEWFDVEFSRYVEPFLGSGAIYFHLEPKRSILSDTNQALVETYNAVKSNPDEIIGLLNDHQKRHSDTYYYEIRGSEYSSDAERAAQFIYLNRTCFNGLYRVNLEGMFNVPKGTKSKVVMPSDDFRSTAKLLSGAHIKNRDFRKTIDKTKESDFLFVDPPYTIKHNNNNFIKYNEMLFSWADQKDLAKWATRAAKKGVSVLISNADHSCIHELYSSKNWTKISVPRHSVLAGSSSFRKGTSELIVSNYLSEPGQLVEPRT